MKSITLNLDKSVPYHLTTYIDGIVYEGEFISIDEENIIFKPLGYPTGQPLEKYKVKLVKLADGTIIFRLHNERIKRNISGIGIKIDKTPIVTIPINWKNLLFEPTLGLEWAGADSSNTTTFNFSLGIYYNFPSNNNFNILTGASTGVSIENLLSDDTAGNDYKINSQSLISSIIIGFQYKLSEDFFFSYETAYQINKDNGGYVKYNNKKEKFESTDSKTSKIISSFIIRYYLN